MYKHNGCGPNRDIGGREISIKSLGGMRFPVSNILEGLEVLHR
jgi:hypothetical protein